MVRIDSADSLIGHRTFRGERESVYNKYACIEEPLQVINIELHKSYKSTVRIELKLHMNCKTEVQTQLLKKKTRRYALLGPIQVEVPKPGQQIVKNTVCAEKPNWANTLQNHTINKGT